MANASYLASESFRPLDYMRSMFCQTVGWLQPTEGKIVWKNTKWRDPNNGKKMGQKEIEKCLSETIALCNKHGKVPMLFQDEIQVLNDHIHRKKPSDKNFKKNIIKATNTRKVYEFLEKAVRLNITLYENQLNLTDIIVEISQKYKNSKISANQGTAAECEAIIESMDIDSNVQSDPQDAAYCRISKNWNYVMTEQHIISMSPDVELTNSSSMSDEADSGICSSCDVTENSINSSSMCDEADSGISSFCDITENSINSSSMCDEADSGISSSCDVIKHQGISMSSETDLNSINPSIMWYPHIQTDSSPLCRNETTSMSSAGECLHEDNGQITHVNESSSSSGVPFELCSSSKKHVSDVNRGTPFSTVVSTPFEDELTLQNHVSDVNKVISKPLKDVLLDFIEKWDSENQFQNNLSHLKEDTSFPLTSSISSEQSPPSYEQPASSSLANMTTSPAHPVARTNSRNEYPRHNHVIDSPVTTSLPSDSPSDVKFHIDSLTHSNPCLTTSTKAVSKGETTEQDRVEKSQQQLATWYGL